MRWALTKSWTQNCIGINQLGLLTDDSDGRGELTVVRAALCTRLGRG